MCRLLLFLGLLESIIDATWVDKLSEIGAEKYAFDAKQTTVVTLRDIL